MATQTSFPRFAYRPAFDPRLPDGVWWPESRRLSEQLAKLCALWPPEAGRILGVHYSPPDWDDHPHSVAVPGLRITTAALPHDDTHQLTLTLRGGVRRSIRVIPPETPTRDAEQLLDGVVGCVVRRASRVADQSAWENEGGALSHPDGRPTSPTGVTVPQTITYRGPPVLVGALAHLLREEGLEFKQPRDDRTQLAAVVVVVLTVRSGDNVADRTLDAMIDAAVAKFRKRFGDDAASVDVGNGEDGPQRDLVYGSTPFRDSSSNHPPVVSPGRTAP
jgi:hypothetical protein